MTQSKELTGFYQAYLAWLEKGAPHWEPFGRNAGLCAALYDYCWDVARPSITSLMRELEAQFQEAGLHKSYPFNSGKFHEYRFEAVGYLVHLNSQRIQWVVDHAAV